MARKLDGKIALVTGGTSGIGLAIAQRFVKEGAYVFITGRRAAELDKAVASLGGHGTGVQNDASKLSDLNVRIPTMPASVSDMKPATYSDFKPATV
ncbi:SDR family NAD(P)-dependent oxidoreductase, partial [Lichenifustis flavocetrariae]